MIMNAIIDYWSMDLTQILQPRLTPDGGGDCNNTDIEVWHVIYSME